MTDLTPAQELRAAAAAVRQLAIAAMDTLAPDAGRALEAWRASMHPAIGIPLADLLDAAAGHYLELDPASQRFLAGDAGGDADPQVTIARLCLGSLGGDDAQD